MSAALQLPLLWATHAGSAAMQPPLPPSAIHHILKRLPAAEVQAIASVETHPKPVVTYAFYRKHTENLLRRYLYASTQVGRSPNLLGESVGRGWASSRPVRTFEDALIFVLDVERCLKRLTLLDRQIISRIVLQEYTYSETAVLLGMGIRTVCAKLPQALDRLTEALVESDLLVLPD